MCGQSANRKSISKPEKGFHYYCYNCGDYYVSKRFIEAKKPLKKNERLLLSGYIRENNKKSKKKLWIDTENVNTLLNSPTIPHSTDEKIEKLILYLKQETTYFTQKCASIEFLKRNRAICYAINEDEVEGMLDACEKAGYIQLSRAKLGDEDRSKKIQLTQKGHQYAEELKKTESNSNSAFVAMWFSDEVRDAYESGIKAAIEAEQCGKFKAFRVDNLEHNNDVTDEIIAGIKEARFVVADLTGNRSGVYYEAGFAKGLGKEVILTCRKDWFDGDDDSRKVHFDVNHLSIIVWETPEELKTKLINRIRATIL